jgi:hypothetical protein
VCATLEKAGGKLVARPIPAPLRDLIVAAPPELIKNRIPLS